MQVLAGDIGGTNTRLALYEVKGSDLRSVRERVFPSEEFETLEEIVGRFLAEVEDRCRDACFGIPGPVKKGRAETTNLPWVVEERRLEQELRIGRVILLNDLEAHAYGIAALHDEDLFVLNQGDPDAEGNAALIAPGTGLGQAGLFWDGSQHRPFASEGGHTAFAARDDQQFALRQFLSKRFGHVSWERVISGPGLINIHDFLLQHRGQEAPDWLERQMTEGDAAAAISKAGLEGTWDLCVEAMNLFVGFYGSEAANLALKVLATGGVYLGGGITPKILAKLKEPAFMDSFLDKGRRRPLLEQIPVRVILNEKSGLLGAARRAALEAGEV